MDMKLQCSGISDVVDAKSGDVVAYKYTFRQVGHKGKVLELQLPDLDEYHVGDRVNLTLVLQNAPRGKQQKLDLEETA